MIGPTLYVLIFLAILQDVISLPEGCSCISQYNTEDCKTFDCTCPCDLTRNHCDLGCCCDSDCGNITDLFEKYNFCTKYNTEESNLYTCSEKRYMRKVNLFRGLSVAFQDSNYVCITKPSQESSNSFYPYPDNKDVNLFKTHSFPYYIPYQDTRVNYLSYSNDQKIFVIYDTDESFILQPLFLYHSILSTKCTKIQAKFLSTVGYNPCDPPTPGESPIFYSDFENITFLSRPIASGLLEYYGIKEFNSTLQYFTTPIYPTIKCESETECNAQTTIWTVSYVIHIQDIGGMVISAVDINLDTEQTNALSTTISFTFESDTANAIKRIGNPGYSKTNLIYIRIGTSQDVLKIPANGGCDNVYFMSQTVAFSHPPEYCLSNETVQIGMYGNSEANNDDHWIDVIQEVIDNGTTLVEIQYQFLVLKIGLIGEPIDIIVSCRRILRYSEISANENFTVSTHFKYVEEVSDLYNQFTKNDLNYFLNSNMFQVLFERALEISPDL